MKKFLIALMLVTGCSYSKVKESVGLGPTAEEIKAKQDEEAQRLKDADALVLKWADQIDKSRDDYGGYKHHEGLTEIDPWGQPVRVDYSQKWATETASVRSAGPDGKFDTPDDMVRTRKTSNPLGMWDGLPSWVAALVVTWVVCIPLGFLFAAGVGHHRVAKGKPAQHKRPLAFVAATVLIAPLVAFVYGMQFLGGALGATGEFFDGFEFDFIDIDIG